MTGPEVEQINAQYLRFKFQIQFHYNDAVFLAATKEELVQLLKANLPANTANRVIADVLNSTSDLKEQVLSLLDQVRLSGLAQTHPDQFGRLQENLGALAKKEQLEAQAKLAAKPTSVHAKVTAAVAQAVQVNAKLAGQEDLLETALINNPQDALTAVEEIASPTPKEVLSLPDLVEAAATLDPAITLTVNAVAEALPSETPDQAVSAITYYKIVNPDISPEQLTQLTQGVEIAVAAATSQPFDIPASSITQISSYSPPTSTAAIAQELTRIELVSTGTDPGSAATLAQQFTSLGLLDTSYKIAQYLPSSPNEPVEKKVQNNRFGFTQISTAFLENIALQQHPPRKFNPQLIRQQLLQQKKETGPDESPSSKTLQRAIDHMYDLARYQVAQVQDYPQKPDSEDRSFSQVLDLLDQADSLLSDPAKEALFNWFKSLFSSSETPIAGLAVSTPAAIVGTLGGAAAGIAVAPAAATAFTTPQTFALAESWFIRAHYPALLQAYDLGYIATTPFQISYEGGVLRLFFVNPEGLSWFTNFLSSSASVPGVAGGGLLPQGIKVFTSSATQAARLLATPAAGSALAPTTAVATAAGTELAVAGTSATTTAAVGAAAGNAIVPIIGAAVGFIVGALLPTIIKYAKKFFSEFLVPLGGLAMLTLASAGAAIGFALTGTFQGALIGTGAGFLGHQLWQTLTQPIGSAPTVIHHLGAFAAHVSAGLATAAVSSILLPALIIILSLPPIIALFLFIINSSAFVIPPSGFSGSSGPVTLGPGGEYPYCWPVEGDIQQLALCESDNPNWSHCTLHSNAIDIGGVGVGKQVYSTHDGTVVHAGWNSQGYGNLVIISSSNGISTYYAHLSQVLVSVGNKITAGTAVGLTGNTGNSTGPHLHYELRPPSNPIKYFLPFGNSCERYKLFTNTLGCFSQTAGGADSMPTGCHD